MIVTCIQEKSAELSHSFPPCSTKWVNMPQMLTRSKQAWVSVPRMFWMVPAVSQRSTFNISSNFAPCPVCICVLLFAHTLTHTYPRLLALHHVWMSADTNVHPCLMCVRPSVWLLWSLRCLWALLEECVQQQRRGEWQLMSPVSPDSEAKNKKTRRQGGSPWLAHWRLPGAWQVHSHVLEGKKKRKREKGTYKIHTQRDTLVGEQV